MATVRLKVLHCGQMKRFLNCYSCNRNTNLKEILHKSYRRRILDVNVLSNQVNNALNLTLTASEMSSANVEM